MPGTSRTKRKWLTPQREGQGVSRLAKRYCRVCGIQVKEARIMKATNICEHCAKKFQNEREGKWACKGCGKIAPEQLERHNGYCEDCVCRGCGRPDPKSVRRTGLCSQCLGASGLLCTRCGREAPAQVKKNKGLCDVCKAD